jgi:arylformamidase
VRIRLETLLDVSRPLREGLSVWPGDVAFRRDVSRPGPQGAEEACVTISALTLSSHTGTHVDAPLHVDPRGGDLEALGLTPFLGPAVVIDARRRRALDEGLVAPDVLRSGARLLFRTDYLASPGEAEVYGPHIPYLTPGLARALAESRVPLVGLDGPSVDPYASRTLEAHRLLAAAGVAILEGLDLSRAEPGEWVLIALPLRLVAAEASPVRAVLARAADFSDGD